MTLRSGTVLPIAEDFAGLTGLRKPNFTEAEVAMLVHEISRSAKLLFGPVRVHVLQRQKLWRDMCKRLNAAHHHYRDSEDLRKKWRELKRKLMAKKQFRFNKVERQILRITQDTFIAARHRPRAAIKREERTVPQEPPSCFNNVAQQKGPRAALGQQQPGPTKAEPVEDEVLLQVEDAFPLQAAAELEEEEDEPMAENESPCSFQDAAFEEEAQSLASVAASLPGACAGVQLSSAKEPLCAQNDRIADLLLCVKSELSRIGDIMEKMLKQMLVQSQASPSTVSVADVPGLLTKFQTPPNFTSNINSLRRSARLKNIRESVRGVRKLECPRKP